MSAVDTGSITTPPTTAPGEIPRSDMRVIWLLLVAAFVAILNETTMGIAIPHLNADLGIPPELGQWLTSAFMLTMAVVIPTTGFILQRFTTRQVFLAAMIAFSTGTLVAMIAPGFGVLLVGRVIQAAGTGIMMPLLMTTIMNVVPPQSRGRMMGRVGLVISLAPAIGPTLAGAVLETLNWRALFAIVLPIAIVSLLMGAKWMTNLGETRAVPLDVISIPLAALGFGGIVFGLSQFGGHGGSGEVVGVTSLVAGAVALALFVWRQLVLQRIDDALLDLRVFRSVNFTFSVIIMTILALSMFGTLTLLPQYLQNVAGLNALQSGLILLPGSVLMGLLGPVMGRVYDARGTRPLLIPGTIFVSAALFYYSTVGEHTVWWVLIIVQAVMSVGLAMSFTPLFSASLGSLQRSLYSHGSAVLNTLQQVGGAAGVAVLTVTYSAILHAGEAEGLETAAAGAPGARTAFLIAAIISLAAVALSAFVRKPADDVAGAVHGH
ncbi:MDR family MFS transporter [uncultured Microbacterium sp.]|uniref:MDR family MFS transporter n=1 Tax=uncultured Microbacterium sp. TaxID=191216 RepID=UPI0028D27C8D|nr:MDR family MFS transporter [uncultured Microbacterium sp.]